LETKHQEMMVQAGAHK